MINIQKNLIVLLILMLISTFTYAQDCDYTLPKSTPLERFKNNNDGTISDIQTGLMWKQCVEGTFFKGAGVCSTDPALTVNWQNALFLAEDVARGTTGENMGYIDWRLPNAKELESIIERQCINPSINLKVFPDTPASPFWSSTPYSSAGASKWMVIFNYGIISTTGSGSFYVRLVRDL